MLMLEDVVGGRLSRPGGLRAYLFGRALRTNSARSEPETVVPVVDTRAAESNHIPAGVSLDFLLFGISVQNREAR